MRLADNRTNGSRPLWLESRLLLAICLADVVVTVGLIASGKAVEANPLLSAYLGMGIQWFLVAKLVLFCLVPIGLVEWMRERYPSVENRLRIIVRVGLVGYAALYLIGLAAANT
jgi:hypothetical protein